MNGRLTIREFELLKRALQFVEFVGQAELMEDPLKRNNEIEKFFSQSRPRVVDTINQVRVLRDKISKIAGE